MESLPEGRLELPWAQSPLDFESSAYTNFATPAQEYDNKTLDAQTSNGGGSSTFQVPSLGFGVACLRHLSSGQSKQPNFLLTMTEANREFTVNDNRVSIQTNLEPGTWNFLLGLPLQLRLLHDLRAKFFD